MATRAKSFILSKDVKKCVSANIWASTCQKFKTKNQSYGFIYQPSPCFASFHIPGNFYYLYQLWINFAFKRTQSKCFIMRFSYAFSIPILTLLMFGKQLGFEKWKKNTKSSNERGITWITFCGSEQFSLRKSLSGLEMVL